MDSTLTVDVLVIGWGKAGKTLAGRLAGEGRTVALVERSPKMYGGTCINIGCVPTKDLIDSAEHRRPEDDPREWFTASVASRDALISKLNAANHAMLEGKVTLIDGTARFTGPHDVEVVNGEETMTVTADTIIIDTGSTTVRPPIEGLDLPGVHDSTSIQHVDPLPERLAIIGGGFIGCEFASMFAQYGSKVTVLDAGEEFLPRLDRDIAEQVHQTLTEDHGVDIRLGATVSKVDKDEDGLAVVLEDGQVGADAVLLAIGRRPATDDLGCEAAGVELDDRGAVVVDDQLRTSQEHIFAVGDVNGGPQFTYISLDDNRIVWDALHDGPRRRSDRVAVPSTTFITPPLAQVGLTRDEARSKGVDALVASKEVASIAAMPRPKILGQTRGTIRLVVDASSHEILGATIFSVDAQELINLVSLAMRQHVTAEDLRDGIWTHPSSTEAFNEVLSDLQPIG